MFNAANTPQKPSDSQSSRATRRKLALLIDADNARPDLAAELMVETQRYGDVTIRRAYGDWTEPNMRSWRQAMLDHAIQPVQQWRYTIGKNATDSAMIIDAMDVLHSGVVQGFCIVSSDSDYTRLCVRIRESGLFVMGIGQYQTPSAFVQACDVFAFEEHLYPRMKSQIEAENAELLEKYAQVMAPYEGDSTPTPNGHAPEASSPETVPAANGTQVAAENGLISGTMRDLVEDAFNRTKQPNGWAELSVFGSMIRELAPEWDLRKLGYSQLSRFVKDHPASFQIKSVRRAGHAQIYVRLKK